MSWHTLDIEKCSSAASVQKSVRRIISFVASEVYHLYDCLLVNSVLQLFKQRHMADGHGFPYCQILLFRQETISSS